MKQGIGAAPSPMALWVKGAEGALLLAMACGLLVCAVGAMLLGVRRYLSGHAAEHTETKAGAPTAEAPRESSAARRGRHRGDASAARSRRQANCVEQHIASCSGGAALQLEAFRAQMDTLKKQGLAFQTVQPQACFDKTFELARTNLGACEESELEYMSWSFCSKAGSLCSQGGSARGDASSSLKGSFCSRDADASEANPHQGAAARGAQDTCCTWTSCVDLAARRAEELNL